MSRRQQPPAVVIVALSVALWATILAVDISFGWQGGPILHSLMWSAQPCVRPDLVSVLAGVGDRALRMMTGALAVAVLASWHRSWWRTLRGVADGADAGRATGVMLAVALLLFETRTLWPWFTPADRVVLGCLAHIAMLGTILAKIYIHGTREVGTFRPRRAAMVHLAMLGICFAAAAIAR